MLGLTLREEFRGKRLRGTAIELSNDQRTGATQIAAKQFLEITYPTHDLLKGIEAIGPKQGRPVVVMGERGLGKSHLMAALYHAVTDHSRDLLLLSATPHQGNHFQFWMLAQLLNPTLFRSPEEMVENRHRLNTRRHAPVDD